MAGIKASGKGTQARFLSERLNIPHISSGDLFREIDKNSKLGKEIRSYIDKGEYVPDDLTLKLVLKRLEKKDCKNGFILDGFPRTLNQAKTLDIEHKLDKVLFIDISRQEAMQRVAGRRVCSNTKCNRSYNIYTAPKPKVENKCDECGSKLFQRKDETKEAATKRINTDIKENTPMIEYYKQQGILIVINGEKPIKEVQREIQNKLNIS